MLTIAIPTEEGKLFSHFGRARSFTIFQVDEEAGRIVSMDVFNAPPHGQCSDLGAQLAQQGVNMVIVGGIGGGAVQHLDVVGIRVLAGAPSVAPQLLVEGFLTGELVGGEPTCSEDHGDGHHHHGGACRH